MPTYGIIDTHAHIFPATLAEKAVKNISHFYGFEGNFLAGTSDNLISTGNNCGISNFVIHSTATTVKQVRSINKFIADETKIHPQFIGLITLHPDQTEEEIKNEIQFALDNNLKGVKLHPDFQKFKINEERAEKIYYNTQGKLPILFHTGDIRFDFSTPEKLAEVAKKFPNQICIAAHFGGYTEWEKINCYMGLDNVYFDTCSSLFFLEKTRATEIIKTLGADKFLFATDYPMWEPKKELARFLSLPLTDKEKDLILYKNAKRIYNL